MLRTAFLTAIHLLLKLINFITSRTIILIYQFRARFQKLKEENVNVTKSYGKLLSMFLISSFNSHQIFIQFDFPEPLDQLLSMDQKKNPEKLNPGKIRNCVPWSGLTQYVIAIPGVAPKLRLGPKIWYVLLKIPQF